MKLTICPVSYTVDCTRQIAGKQWDWHPMAHAVQVRSSIETIVKLYIQLAVNAMGVKMSRERYRSYESDPYLTFYTS